jgi:predicted phage terminase large subunit-like protein
MKKSLGQYDFQSQYQQNPMPREGLIVKKEWLKYYKPGEEPATFDRIIQSWDTANKAHQLADYSICTTWGIKGSRFYLLHVLRRRMEFPELKRAIIQHRELFKAQVVLIEDKASGTQVIQDLLHSGFSYVKPYTPPACDKLMRLHTQTPTIEGGFVYLPETASWLGDYVAELTGFPAGKHDDQVDSTTQFFDWVKSDGREPGILGYMRMLSEQNGRF